MRACVRALEKCARIILAVIVVGYCLKPRTFGGERIKLAQTEFYEKFEDDTFIDDDDDDVDSGCLAIRRR